MARATTKAELIESADEKFTQLWALISAMPKQALNSEFNFDRDFLDKQKEAHWARDHNVRDVLIHLHEWHKLLLNWVDANQRGDARAFLPAPYNWKTYGQLNVDFWTQHQKTSYQQAQDLLKTSHADVMTLIHRLSNDALFTKNHFSWTGTPTLGSYAVSTTASHYDWATKKINKYIKTYQSKAS